MSLCCYDSKISINTHNGCRLKNIFLWNGSAFPNNFHHHNQISLLLVQMMGVWGESADGEVCCQCCNWSNGASFTAGNVRKDWLSQCKRAWLAHAYLLFSFHFSFVISTFYLLHLICSRDPSYKGCWVSILSTATQCKQRDPIQRECNDSKLSLIIIN